MEQDRRSSGGIFSRFQRWFLITSVLNSAVFVLMLGGSLYLWFRSMAMEFMNLAGVLSPTLLDKLQKSLTQGLLLLGLICSGMIGLAILQAIRFSRKVAGPIFALARHLDGLAETGKWESLRLRQGDLFLELSEKLDRAHSACPNRSAKEA